MQQTLEAWRTATLARSPAACSRHLEHRGQRARVGEREPRPPHEAGHTHLFAPLRQEVRATAACPRACVHLARVARHHGPLQLLRHGRQLRLRRDHAQLPPTLLCCRAEDQPVGPRERRVQAEKNKRGRGVFVGYRAAVMHHTAMDGPRSATWATNACLHIRHFVRGISVRPPDLDRPESPPYIGRDRLGGGARVRVRPARRTPGTTLPPLASVGATGNKFVAGGRGAQYRIRPPSPPADTPSKSKSSSTYSYPQDPTASPRHITHTTRTQTRRGAAGGWDGLGTSSQVESSPVESSRVKTSRVRSGQVSSSGSQSEVESRRGVKSSEVESSRQRTGRTANSSRACNVPANSCHQATSQVTSHRSQVESR